jgi:SAM-dependent methyltransferase
MLTNVSGLKKLINDIMGKSLGIEIKKINPQRDLKLEQGGMSPSKTISSGNKQWNYREADGWVGGRFNVSNFSQGYHGLLKQWWEYYNKGNLCFLVSENNVVKSEFQSSYPDWQFVTLDLYNNKGESVDVTADLCGHLPDQLQNSFDLVVCQATLEHVYDPFNAMKNIFSLLRVEGVVVLHTHTPVFPYHPYPHDYLRYHPDWFEYIGSHFREAELLELHTTKTGHIFVAYRIKKAEFT